MRGGSFAWCCCAATSLRSPTDMTRQSRDPSDMSPFQHATISRRTALTQFANGFGMLALSGLMAEGAAAAGSTGSGASPLGVKPASFAPRAKRVIFLFMSGGPSHVDLFDPKPKLGQLHGQPPPFEMPKL